MLQKYKLKREEGFTIIEVLIVLAIAGLIMLIVFLAVPALQRNARNNGRNNEASRVSAAVTECLANHNGQTGSCGTAASLGITPSTDFQQFTNLNFSGSGTTTAVVVTYGVKCDSTGTSTTGGSAKDFAVTFQREPAATGNRCIGSQ